ncbi:hypothetical protein PEX1_092170 [Penicillium expansum]|uniref:Uncharacterized protein n=1 Tax=Penicillium expansum TaxID=27334 RepID=A0A0A2IWE3_PENEN|nr:hypothetical protein PEX2_070550 [Penicillium expansum]KGO47442.1 hypothetical protein PEXP_012980 [Penicillium expansum]KGO54522.1 hypothetical protein PEX2_070550 [Penicillium expansum]KGO73118.1 hypothetical protein PEX1_092170 [Penicillium expansum]
MAFKDTTTLPQIILWYRRMTTKLSLFLSSLTSKTIEATAALSVARVCCEWVLLETLYYTRFGIVVRRPWLAVPSLLRLGQKSYPQ